MSDWPDRRQKINYDEDDEWVHFPDSELNSFLYNIDTVVAEARNAKRSIGRSNGKSYLHKTDLSELLIAVREVAKRIRRNAPLDEKGNILRTGSGRQGRVAWEILEDILEQDTTTNIDGQGPERE